MKIIHPNRKFEASFNANRIDRVLQKVCAVLGREIGKHIAIGPIPLPFTKGGKHFHGIECLVGGSLNHRIRFNLLQGDQVEIHSVSMWLDYKETPDYEIELNGFNIVQVVDTLGEVLKNNGPLREALLREASPKRDLILRWASGQEGGINSLHGRFDNRSVYEQFVSWCRDTRAQIISYSIFKWYLREYFESTGNHAAASGVESVSVHPGQSENYVEDQPGMAASIDYLAQQEAELMSTYDLLDVTIKAVSKNNFDVVGAFVYGTGGVGKTTSVEELLERYGVKSKTYVSKGHIEGYDGLVNLLFKFRSNKIIVLDDNDRILENEIAVNILKSAMDLREPRMISVEKRGKAGLVDPHGQAVPQGRRHANSTAMRRNRVDEAIDLNALGHDIDTDTGVDFNPEADDGWTSSYFQFKSKIVFISNMTRIPQPLADRALAVEMNITKDQFFILLKKKLGVVFNELEGVTMEDKEFVMEFMREKKTLIKETTFRLFKKLLNIYLTVDRNAGIFNMLGLKTIRSALTN